MREQSISAYMWFGTVLRFLQDADSGFPIHGNGAILENLDSFLDELDSLGLTVTANAAQNAGLPAVQEDLAETDPDAVLTPDQAKHLVAAVNEVRQTLIAEAAEKKAFVTEPKRWDVDRLLNDPGSMFGIGVYEGLDTHAAFDFREACKCIAFERSTAAAFHIMRGTEAVLRLLYCHTVKQNRLKKDRQMWGPMLEKLRERSKPPPKALLDNLDAIRHNYRNPTQHPDEVYRIDGAQDLLGMVIPAVNQMVELMVQK